MGGSDPSIYTVDSMAGYSSTPLWKKLGFKPGMIACVEGAPASYLKLLDLPRDTEVNWIRMPDASTALVHLFVTARKVLRSRLAALRKTLPSDAVVWVSWPKKTSGQATDITENVVRDVALPLGFVDIKVCAVDETWSGLKLMVRKELR